MTNDTRRHQLQNAIVAALNAADWIYHDLRLDVDGGAKDRSVERLHAFNAQFGREALFGIAGAWALKAYWRLADVFHRKGLQAPPRLLPGNMLEGLPNSNEKKRAYVSAQQFFSAMVADDYDMAEAIFNAAYDASLEDALSFMFCVLFISVKLSNDAKKMGK